MKTKIIKYGYGISTDPFGRFFTTRSTTIKYIKRMNRQVPDLKMKEDNIYRTTNQK